MFRRCLTAPIRNDTGTIRTMMKSTTTTTTTMVVASRYSDHCGVPSWSHHFRPIRSSSNMVSISNDIPLSSPVWNGRPLVVSSSSLSPSLSSLKLFDMITQIPFCIQQRKRGNILPGCTKQDPVLHLMRRLDETTLPTELQKYCYYDVTIPYTRNLIATDNENFTLLLLCWNQNHHQRSPIHNHPGDGCYMRVLSGSILERLYHVVPPPSSSSSSSPLHSRNVESSITYDDGSTATSSPTNVTLECIATNHYTTNQVAFINDSIGYHSIGCGVGGSSTDNPSSSSSSCSPTGSVPGAMSLHLYCPPIRQCQIVVTSSSSSNDDSDVDQDGSRTSNIYVRDSGPMYHHTEYGCRTC